MSNHKKIEGICPYCEKQGVLTLDHVIPRALYANGVPGNSPKVYACSRCNNNLKSIWDAYFRDYLVLDIEGSEHPISKQLFPKFIRSRSRNQSLLAQHAIQAGFELVPRFTPGGLFADFVFGVDIPDEIIVNGLTMMARGLWYYYTKQILPQDSVILAKRQWDMQKLQPDIQILHQLGASYKAAGDGDVFECIYLIPPEKPTTGLWFLCFFKRVYFSVGINLQIGNA